MEEPRAAKNAAVSAAGVALFAVAGAGLVRTGGGKVWRIPVPYCDHHADGVDFDTDFDEPVVRFRWYAAFRAFCEANGTEPREPVA